MENKSEACSAFKKTVLSGQLISVASRETCRLLRESCSLLEQQTNCIVFFISHTLTRQSTYSLPQLLTLNWSITAILLLEKKISFNLWTLATPHQVSLRLRSSSTILPETDIFPGARRTWNRMVAYVALQKVPPS